MAKQVQLKVRSRTGIGKAPAKRLRAEGWVPAVVYGVRTPPVSLAVEARELTDVLHQATGENVLVDLLVDENGQTSNRLALIQEVQHHPVTDQILHVDFHGVSATEKLRTVVPVRAIGEPAGVKTGGGVLEYVMRELRVECLPKDLPDVIEINVEALEIGQSLHLAAIHPPAGVAFLDASDQTVFIVAAPVTEEELAAATETAAAEPEVIGAVKEEGAEGAPAEGEAGKGEAKAAAGKGEAKGAAGKGEAKAPAAGKADAKAGAGKGEVKAAAPGKGDAKAPAAGGKPAGKGAGGKSEGKK